MATKKIAPPSAPAARPTGRMPFRVRNSPIQGRGVFATRAIARGERIAEYVGERIAREEGDLRYDDDEMDRPHTFLFTLDDDTAIDGNVRGNESRYINHSCGPNCESVIEDGRIFIDAIRNIPVGAEITYDYHLVRPGRFRAEWRERYACRCGTPNCRGMLLELPKRRASAKGAEKKGTAKKGTAKKGGAEKGVGRKAAVRKVTVKRAATAKKTSTRAAKRSGAVRKAVVGKAAAKKAPARTGAAKKASAGKAAAKKSAPASGAARKAVRKAARKAARKAPAR